MSMKECTMHSYLITGPDPNENYRQALRLAEKLAGVPIHPEKQPDLLLIAPGTATESVKIAQIRQLKKDLSVKPISLTIKVALILQAEQLTPAAQNALLKTLEEPPRHVRIILTANSADLLLETIVSRCLVSRDHARPQSEQSTDASAAAIAREIISLPEGERLAVADRLGLTKNTLGDFISGQLTFWHGQLVTRSKWSKKQVLQALKALQEAQALTTTQVNHQFIIDQLLMAFPNLEK